MQYVKLGGFLLVIAACGGCSGIRSIEQWKCDHLGMCHFGIKPTSTHTGMTNWGSSVPVYSDAGGMSPAYRPGELMPLPSAGAADCDCEK